MARKVGIVALMVMGLVAMVAAAADAHYINVSGKLVYHSIFCESVIKNVQNLVNNPALATCLVVGTTIETECTNPQGKVVRGTPSHSITFGPAAAPLEQTDLEKKKGRAHVDIEVIEDDVTLGLTSEQAGCNNNWTVTKALLREADITIDVYSCGADGVCTTPEDIIDANHASTATYSCVLPATFTLDNVPLPLGTTVDCTLESFTHLQ